MASVKGRCNCGAIEISLPKSSFPESTAFCHCLSCRASSGGIFSVNLTIPTKDISVEGTPKIYADSDTASGNTCDRHFCGDCGSPIMSIVREAPDKAFVKGGLFCKQGVELPPPRAEVFWKRHEAWETPAKNARVIE